MTTPTPEILTRAATELRDYADQQQSLYDVKDDNLAVLADALDVLAANATGVAARSNEAPVPLSISEIQDRLTRAKSPLFHAIGHTDVRIVLTALRSPSVGLAIVPRQSNAAPELEEVDPRRLDVGDPEAVAAHRRNEALLDGGQRAHPEAGTVPFEDAGLDEDPFPTQEVITEAATRLLAETKPGNPEGEFMSAAAAYAKGYEMLHEADDTDDDWEPAVDGDANDPSWVLARPPQATGYTVEAFAGHFTFKHNAKVVEEYNTHAALCERIQELLNQRPGTPEPPRAADLMRADKRNPSMIVEDGIAHHLIDVQREARGPYATADRTALLIRGAVRDGRRDADPDGATPFYVLAALRELGVTL